MTGTNKGMNGKRNWLAATTTQFFTLGLLFAPLAMAAEHAEKEPPRVFPLMNVKPETTVFSQTSGPLTVGYQVGGGQVTVAFSAEGEHISYRFRLVTDAKPALRPEFFARTWGTRDGMAAVTRMLTDMLAGKFPDIKRRIDPPSDPTPTGVHAIALFEDAGVTRFYWFGLKKSRRLLMR